MTIIHVLAKMAVRQANDNCRALLRQANGEPALTDTDAEASLVLTDANEMHKLALALLVFELEEELDMGDDQAERVCEFVSDELLVMCKKQVQQNLAEGERPC